MSDVEPDCGHGETWLEREQLRRLAAELVILLPHLDDRALAMTRHRCERVDLVHEQCDVLTLAVHDEIARRHGIESLPGGSRVRTTIPDDLSGLDT